MLQSMNQSDYHTFRLPYWDWRSEVQNSFGLKAEDLFTANRLGETRHVGGFPRVFGALYDGGWDTVCWLQLGQICDPRTSTGPLQRCPFVGEYPCTSGNPDWPSQQQFIDAMAFDIYDAPPYDITSMDGFRSFVDFKVGTNASECRNIRMCQCVPLNPQCNGTGPALTLTGQMHFVVSTLQDLAVYMLLCIECIQTCMSDGTKWSKPNAGTVAVVHVSGEC